MKKIYGTFQVRLIRFLLDAGGSMSEIYIFKPAPAPQMTRERTGLREEEGGVHPISLISTIGTYANRKMACQSRDIRKGSQ